MSMEVASQDTSDRATEWRHASRAIEEAQCSPGNARVGAVIALGDKILATGFKGERENRHAEQVALEKASELGVDVAGATIYTTLEPCANSRTSRIPCAQHISDAGISAVHIGEYDPNPQVNRLGWKHLRDHGIKLRDFPTDLREKAHVVSENFTRVFTRGAGMSSGAKFDFTLNGGRFVISADELPDSPSWNTRWGNRDATSIYLKGDVPGVVALARYAEDFDEIDDPGALDYASHFAQIDIGSIGAVRSEHGYVLCKVIAIEPAADYGGSGQVSVKIKWEIRLAGK